MSLPWFRMYGKIVDNDKLKLLAFEDRWHFVAFCCLKNSGVLDEPESDLRTRRIAVKLGVQVRELEEIARRLREVELIDEGYNPVAWDDLQFRSDNSTDRVRAYREKNKKTKEKQPRNAVKRSRNVTVTAQDTDTDTDTELTPNGVCPSGDGLEPSDICNEWNKVAVRIGRPVIKKLTPERRALVKGRINQYTKDEFFDLFNNVEASPFLRGDTDRWGGVTFDWIMKKSNFQKTIEGNYDR